MEINKKKTGEIRVLAGLLEQLNNSDDIFSTMDEVMVELCEYLDYGCSFYYRADYKNIFHLEKFTAVYPKNDLPSEIDFSDYLEEKDFEIIEHNILYFRESDKKTPLREKLSKIFVAKSLMISPIVSDENEIIGLVGVSDRRGLARTEEDDLTFAYAVLTTICNYIKLQLSQEMVQSTQKALQSVTDNMGVDIYVNDFNTHEVLYANKSMAEPYGDVSNMIGQTCWKYLYNNKTEPCDYCPQKKIIDENGNPTKIYSWDYQRPFDGKWFRVLSAAFNWIDGRLAHIVSSVDITDSKKNEELIKKMAMYDTLTGLPNRNNMTEALEDIVQNMKDLDKEGYVIFFDLDGFKAVNDNYGHQVGDDLLREIGRLLQDNSLTRDRCYRYGGDEFVILLYDAQKSDVSKVLYVLKELFAEPIFVDGQLLKCGASIGVSHFPTDGTEASDLVRQADQGMYVAKINNKERKSRGAI